MSFRDLSKLPAVALQTPRSDLKYLETKFVTFLHKTVNL